jgi:hypothetical protein
MPRVKIPKKYRKDRQLVIRCTDDESRAINRTCRKRKLSRSDYGRSRIDELDGAEST